MTTSITPITLFCCWWQMLSLHLSCSLASRTCTSSWLLWGAGLPWTCSPLLSMIGREVPLKPVSVVHIPLRQADLSMGKNLRVCKRVLGARCIISVLGLWLQVKDFPGLSGVAFEDSQAGFSSPDSTSRYVLYRSIDGGSEAISLAHILKAGEQLLALIEARMWPSAGEWEL